MIVCFKSANYSRQTLNITTESPIILGPDLPLPLPMPLLLPTGSDGAGTGYFRCLCRSGRGADVYNICDYAFARGPHYSACPHRCGSWRNGKHRRCYACCYSLWFYHDLRLHTGRRRYGRNGFGYRYGGRISN